MVLSKSQFEDVILTRDDRKTLKRLAGKESVVLDTNKAFGLLNSGLIELLPEQKLSSGKCAFRLSSKGRHFKEFRSLTRREKWSERLIGFVSGVGVTVVGGFIAKLLAG